MNFHIHKSIVVFVLIFSAFIIKAQEKSTTRAPLNVVKRSDQGNSTIDAGRHAKTVIQLNFKDGNLYVRDLLVNKVKLNGYKSTTWIYLLDAQGNILKLLKVYNWAEGTLIPGPSKRSVGKNFNVSEVADQVASIEVVHTQKGDPQNFKPIKKAIADVIVLIEA